MEIKDIKSGDEYVRAMERLSTLMALNLQPGTNEGNELELLARVVEDYERKIVPPKDNAKLPAAVVQSLVRQDRRKLWSTRWNTPGFKPKWADRGISPEIVAAVETGWLPDRGRVLDVGCGWGEVAVWFAQRGYDATGVDYPEAIRKAIEKYAHLESKPHFLALDICDSLPFDLQFDIFIDRGCLHGIPAVLIGNYVSNISSMASPDARMLLFVRAFREGQPFGDEAETSRHVDGIKRIFSGLFAVESHSPTYLNVGGIRDARNPLPGLVFRLKRSA